MKKSILKERAIKISFILPAMSVLILLTIYPLYLVIEMSLFDFQDYGNPVFSGIENYILVFKDSIFWIALRNTLLFTILSVTLVIITGMIFAILLNQKINQKVRSFFRSIVMFPWLLSSAVVGSIWVLLLSPFGLVNVILVNSGILESGIPWLSDERFALFGVILANVWRGFPFAMLMILAAFQTIPEDTLEAAEVDGATQLKRFFLISLPQIKGILLTVTTLELIWTFRTFDLIYIMTGGGPVNSTEILSTYVYFKAFQNLDFGFASAISIYMLIFMLIFAVFYVRAIIRRED
ncbi:carbohydrate ABC transporter permease [Gracilibacillus alcaliphilus]|uniref:carbohydrate ABC transporter permease n=1 Tax=Gracilibacillus alcaliphilus TaxID=1401441 RepID=UPI00195DB74D|nr:sugar ABC transporter permease [Gracilibacillus alcaliphilus]MBM7677155.1 multiple sugar transport system permease protein [Gracilibacillus alcaliphilus]